MIKKIFFLLFIFVKISHLSQAQDLTEKLSIAYKKFISTEQLKYASVSFSVIDHRSNKLLFGKDEHKGLATASTLKTITAATAFEMLGQDFQFETSIWTNGVIKDGILNGDLIITGSGDPTLGSDRWEATKKESVLLKIYEGLVSKGIQRINGRIIADSNTWANEPIPDGWIYQDIGNYYGAGTSSICWDENKIDLQLIAGDTVGGVVKIVNLNDLYPFVKIKNEVTTGIAKSGDNVYAYLSPTSEELILRGTYGIDLNKKIGITLQDPSLAFAFELSDYLQKKKISTNGYLKLKLNAVDVQKEQVLFTIYSPKLSEIIYWFNQKSINLYGEQLIRYIGWKFGKNSTTAGGYSALQNYWAKQGFDKNSLNIFDGSGLSPQNRVTTFSMARILAFSRNKPWFNSYFKSFPTHNGMKMKSGSIEGVMGYAGYAETRSGQSLSFSILINNYHGSSSSLRQQLFSFLNELK